MDKQLKDIKGRMLNTKLKNFSFTESDRTQVYKKLRLSGQNKRSSFVPKVMSLLAVCAVLFFGWHYFSKYQINGQNKPNQNMATHPNDIKSPNSTRVQPINQHFDLLKLKMINSKMGWAITKNGKVLRTDNAWKSYKDVTPKNVNLLINNRLSQPRYEFLDKKTVFIFFMDPSKLSLSHIKAPLKEIVTHNGGNTWDNRTFNNIQDWGIEDIHFTNAQTGWIYTSANGRGVHPSKLYKTTDGGITWNPMIGKGLLTTEPTWISSNNGNTIWTVGMKTVSGTDGLDASSTMLLKSVDGGNHWDALSLIKHDSKKGIDYKRPMFFGSDGLLAGAQFPLHQKNGTFKLTIFRSDHQQNGWQAYGSFDLPYTENNQYHYPFFNSNNMTLYFSDLNHGWVHTQNNLFITQNGGKSWSKVTDVRVPKSFQFTTSTKGYGLMEGALYETDNGGQSWNEILKSN